jgi:hypothetical protein
MNVQRIAIMLLFLGVVMATSASALTPDTIVVSTDKLWVIAGGTSTSTVQIRVTNATTGTVVTDAEVTAWCLDPQMGTIPIAMKRPNPGANVTYTFTSGLKSGDARIFVSVNHTNLTNPLTTTGIQRVDHAAPKYFTQITPPPAVESQFPVGDNTTITFRILDRYGNKVDNKRVQTEYSEKLKFIDSETFNGGFWNGTILQKVFSNGPDADGNIHANYLLPTFANLNPIGIIAPVGVINNFTLRNDVMIFIRGVALDPEIGGDIISVVSPSIVQANGTDTVNIIYTVYDKYGNPVPEYTFKWWTSIDERLDLKTNSQGQVYIVYGPKDIPGSVTLYARFSNNYTLKDSTTITFMSTGPTDFLLSGFPQIIPSLDVTENSSSQIRVKVIDGFGNPVEGEAVTFAITGNSSYPSQLQYPTLDAMSSTTNKAGYAIVNLIPGKFPRPGNPIYDIDDHMYASGYATVTATWNEVSKEITVEYKNYPHLRIEAEVYPENVTVGDEVEVTVKIIGDGYALKKPVDVMLLNDRSNSMLNGIYSNNDPVDRMQDTMVAAQAFVGAMDNGFDRVGIASFGDMTPNTTANLWNFDKLWTKAGTETSTSHTEAYHDMYISANYIGNGTQSYNDFTTIDMDLTSYFQDGDVANTAIRSLIPYNTFVKDGSPENQYSASLRHGLFKTITYMRNETPTYTKSRTIVGLIDTDFTWYGNPLAASSEMTTPFAATGGNAYWPFSDPDNPSSYDHDWSRTNPLTTYQNMSNYAKGNNIKLFMIVYSSGSVNSEGIIRTLCSATGGQSFHASTPAELIEKFLEIARLIHRLAGVDTEMYLDFGTMEVTFNNTLNTSPGSDVFEYVHDDSLSTFFTKYETKYPEILIQPPPAGEPSLYPYVIDQSDQWNGIDPHLQFNVGNISIDETWEAHFTLRAKQAGIVNLFGNNSMIHYTDTSGEIPYSMNLALPKTSVIVTEDPLQQTVTLNVVDIIDGSLNATPSQSTELLEISWLLNYTGNETVKQIAYYQFSPDRDMWSGDWIQFHTDTTGGHNLTFEPFDALLDVRDHTGWVRIKIYTFEEPLGGPSDDEIISDPIQIGVARSTSIRIS